MIPPFTLGRTPPPPGPQATREAASALTPPLLDRVFPPDQSDDMIADAHNYGRSPLAYGARSAPAGEVRA